MSILNNILSDNPDTIEDIKNLKTDLNTLKNADVKTHSHNISNINELQNELNTIKSSIPKITSGTTDLVAGQSTLPAGTIYLVYEE